MSKSKTLAVGLVIFAWGSLAAEPYRKPPEPLLRLLDAPNTPEMKLDPKGQWMSLAVRPNFLSIEQLALPEMKLAGLRFHPGSRASGRDKYYQSLQLKNLTSGKLLPLKGLPNRPRLTALSWSPDASHLAFVQVDPSGSQLWVAEVKTGQARRLGAKGLTLNGCLGFSLQWAPDSRSILVMANTPSEAPKLSRVPVGPNVLDHGGGKASTRTFQDLLKSPDDESWFAYYLTSQPTRVNLQGDCQKLAPAALYRRVEAAPDGQHVLLESIQRPFSYSVPWTSFGLKSWVINAKGQTVQTVRQLPLEENLPPDFDSVRPGRRALEWRADRPATLFWAEALDQGNPRQAASFRDQLYLCEVGQSPQAWIRTSLRYKSIDWGDGNHALIRHSWYKTRRTQVEWAAPDQSSRPAQLVLDYSSEDRYKDPGEPLRKSMPNGQWLLRLEGEKIFLSGLGASPEGDRPFLDELDLSSGNKRRLFQSQAPYFERPVRLLQSSPLQLFTTRETPQDPPNLCLRQGEQVKALTNFQHPAPELAKINKEILRYRRRDGVELTATLYTPPGYDGKSKLPVLVWAYPDEFKDAKVAGQVKDSPYRYLRPFWGGAMFFAMRGYAVVENPAFPIVGEGTQEPNDNYVEQLVMNASAAIEAVSEKGVGDRNRCAIGGHSYGAFTAANLLAHSQLFRCGIARSGAYNRTLTPFGFQSEERTFWEAPQVYSRMAPFSYADKIDEPLLLIHGAEDSNPGTLPMQSERLFQAIKGLGGQARLVMLPKESHSYAARESVLQVMYEMDRWLQMHLAPR
jgi:dipeptidyl aminopeptidase/acylaminoacyl peptidase